MQARIAVSIQSGTPTAEVPCPDLWDLVEYLSFQRVNVRYTLKGDHFAVCFVHQTLEGSQRLMDEWAESMHRAEYMAVR